MATTGTVYVDESIVGQKGNVIVYGRLLAGQNATFDARDFGLRTLKAITITPWGQETSQSGFIAGSMGSQGGKEYRRRIYDAVGSIGSLGVLGNYVRVRALRLEARGSILFRQAAAQGTKALYMGTVAGSMRMNYTAVGR